MRVLQNEYASAIEKHRFINIPDSLPSALVYLGNKNGQALFTRGIKRRLNHLGVRVFIYEVVCIDIHKSPITKAGSRFYQKEEAFQDR
jgi:hypothetical protein